MSITGENLIGASAVRGTGESFQAIEAATGEPIAPAFGGASLEDLDRALTLASEAFGTYSETDLETRAKFLETIADEILAIGDELVERAMAESGLPRPRLEGERGRTVGQLKMFAGVVRDGAFLDLRIDPALPERKPMPRPDLRLRNIPVGPVAVFGASNFPLAFSVAGGDTASALAAGCPVVVKAHPAHPGTSELVGRAVQKAVAACGLPEGVFSLLFDAGRIIGQALVADARVAAVGFTGSRAGGLALMKIASTRDVPIPVYAEMSSINPVVLFPGALAARGDAIAKAFAGSVTLGAGQFCTNPGLILGLEGDALDGFVAAAGAALSETPASTMLTPGIHAAYEKGVAKLAGHAAVKEIARGKPGAPTAGQAGLYEVDAETFLADPALQEEIFGATGLVVRCADLDQLSRVLASLEGQLTAAIHIDETDHDAARSLLPLLERKVGRILVNGFGTGVEVAHAMVHGGPFPATSDGRTTSVGSLAINRFLRPVSYQDLPDDLLPAPLKSDNPLGAPRRVDGGAPAR
ncbi:NADP-dependent aldehyde dehydrogenase [Methylopila capsulata]|uniref:2,5-dioxovalerate dehydrogenase n=1 Tax=Methylopila capsulata TaxID=61654 RepID=A0A9W6MT76_9HYPH|nr:aldehyde dehydrogenase (NADP(+)) [Methylopila capsulata]MBM7852594.1 NADP-dependent aldehyde dehydrogenase [Methylopila capsulata]GLK56801.1 fatty aldehyde dehydrogenase [Methylopila capsulata]